MGSHHQPFGRRVTCYTWNIPQASVPILAIDLTHEKSLEMLLEAIQSLELRVTQWSDEDQKNTVHDMRAAIDALNKEAMARMIRAFRKSEESSRVLKEAVRDPLVYAVLRHHQLIKPSIHERIEAALETVRPMLAGHGGNVELVSVELPTVTVKLIGTCNGCPAADLTLSEGIEKAIKEFVPEVTEIKTSKGLAKSDCAGGVQYISPFAKSDSRPWTYLTTIDAISEGQYKIVDIGETSYLLSRDGDQVSCYINACAHLGLKLDGAAVAEGIITCPFHGFRYALSSGECLTVPEVQLQICPIRIVDRRVEVQAER